MTETSGAGSDDSAGRRPATTSLRTGTGTGADGMDLTVHVPADDQLVIDVHGELDMLTSPQLRREVLDRLPAAALVVLALDEVSFLGTSGLAALIELREHAQRSGTTLRLACTERRVLRPLSIAGLHHLFDIRDTVPEALAQT